MRNALSRGAALLCVLLVQCGGRSALSVPETNESGGNSGTNAGGGDTLPAGGRAGDGGARALGGGGATNGGQTGSAGESDAGDAGAAGAAGAGGETAPESCPVPLAPVLDILDHEETLRFKVDGTRAIQFALLDPGVPLEDAQYGTAPELSLSPFRGKLRVLARAVGPDCAPRSVFDAMYEVRDFCPLAPGNADSNAVAASDPRIVGWANGVESYRIGEGEVPLAYQDPKAALGPANAGKSVVTLGDGGWVTMTFEPMIRNGDGYDFAVFENGFNDSFLELGFVEVSSDGETFARFDSAFLGSGPPSPGYAGDAGQVCSLAGSFRQLFGTPFDLQALSNQPAVRDARVDLEAIAYVRIVDIIGDGQTLDSFGRGIFDPTPTPGASGFDLDAIAVLHAR